MDSSRLRAVVVLLLAVAALGAAGAAIDGDGAGGGSPGAGGGSGFSVGDGDGGGLFPDSGDDPTYEDSLWFRIVVGGIVALTAIGLAVLFVVALVRWDLRQWLVAVGATLLFLVACVAVAVGLRTLLEVIANLFGASGNSGGLGGDGSGGVGGDESGAGVDLPLTAVAGLLGVAIVGAILLARLASADSGDETERDVPEGPSIESNVAAPSGTTPPGRASGGDRTADNEVYRAWLALADAADADPRRDSPGTVARRAREAGVDGRAAREITALFEAVRYGGAEPSAELEQRAATSAERLGGEGQ